MKAIEVNLEVKIEAFLTLISSNYNFSKNIALSININGGGSGSPKPEISKKNFRVKKLIFFAKGGNPKIISFEIFNLKVYHLGKKYTNFFERAKGARYTAYVKLISPFSRGVARKNFQGGGLKL